MTSRFDPSTEPDVPNSANKNCVTCSSLRFIRLQISAIFAKIVFLLPSRRHCGGGILYDLLPGERMSGLYALTRVKKRLSSRSYETGV